MENTIARTCPFCGHHEVELQKIRGPKDMPQQFHAICVMCQATAPFSDSEEGAIEEWNERACDRQPAAPETVDVKALASATGSASLVEAVKVWRHAEKRHAAMVLGAIGGDMDEAKDIAERRLHAVRIESEKLEVRPNAELKHGAKNQ